MSGIGCYFMFLSCSNFNPIAKNSSSKFEKFAALQECVYLTSLYGAIMFFMYESILGIVFLHSSCIQTSF